MTRAGLVRRPRHGVPGAILGIDSGGTFTDFVLVDRGRVTLLKLPSTPEDPARAILSGVGVLLGESVARRRAARVSHGTTVATNALLTGRFGRAAFVTTEGFEDLIEIGRQARERLYDWNEVRPRPLIARARRIGLRERAHPGRVSLLPRKGDLDALVRRIARLRRAGVESVAVGLLHSWADPRAERAVGRRLRRAGVAVTLSHALCSEHREYERFSTAVANACLQPVMEPYLRRIGSALPAD